jgi:Holliday junction resolvase RusA-like endonuclease
MKTIENIVEQKKRIHRYVVSTPPAITFSVLGKPIPKARPRGKGHFNGKQHFYTDKSTLFWEMLTRLRASEIIGTNSPLKGALAAEMLFTFQSPKKQHPYHTAKPDLSNVIKAVEDGMEGVLFENDSQIVYYLEPYKTYGDQPGVVVSLWGLPDNLLEGENGKIERDSKWMGKLMKGGKVGKSREVTQ